MTRPRPLPLAFWLTASCLTGAAACSADGSAGITRPIEQVDAVGPLAIDPPVYRDAGSDAAAAPQTVAPAAPGCGPLDAAVDTGPAATCAASLPAEVRARWVAYDSDKNDFHRQLFAIRADGSESMQLLTDDSVDREPAYAPDGKVLSFTSDRDGTPQIYLLDPSTKQVTKVTSRPEGADQSSFSHDGKLLTFHSGASVYTINRDGSGEHLVATGTDSFNAYYWPHFSLDDKELVFDRNNEIDASTLDGQLRQIVQNTTTTIKAPAVSPDGHEVAYAANCYFDTGTSIWTTPFTNLTDVCGGRGVSPKGDQAAEHPAWGTSAVLAYHQVDRANNLARLVIISRAVGSAPCVITPADADSRNPAWAP